MKNGCWKVSFAISEYIFFVVKHDSYQLFLVIFQQYYCFYCIFDQINASIIMQ